MTLLPYTTRALIKIFALSTAFIGCSAYASPTPDAELPVKIQADNANFDHGKGQALYTGNVIVDQGSRHLSADKLIIQRNKDNTIKIMIATGNPATFHSQADPNKPMGLGKAKTIKYYPKQDAVDLIDHAELAQNGDTITGPLINYNFTSGNLNTKSSASERATFILQPKREP